MNNIFSTSGIDVLEIKCNCPDEVVKHLVTLPIIEGPDWAPSIPWIFRGHGCADWRLVSSLSRQVIKPSIPRVKHSVEEYVSKLPLSFEAWSESDRNLLWRYVEKECSNIAKDFIIRSVRTGSLAGSAADAANRALNNYNVQTSLISVGNCDVLVALAQHHGIPTALLDWTTDPFTALWFSISEDNHDWPSGDACVWACRTSSLPDTTGVQVFADQDYPRAQAGVFTLRKYDDQEFAVSCKITPLDGVRTEATNGQITNENLLCFRFSRSFRNKLLIRLRMMGVGRYRLKPTLDNIANKVLRT